ncbi:hypothetical protein VNO78_17862 [Psophocarpus tetragonolobus]|uniref:Uncharacterized protein n=1 Tax=Psophocarpus tetragonolobus TaxID=3891 RepID=A0AAN9XLG8_PSOTE
MFWLMLNVFRGFFSDQLYCYLDIMRFQDLVYDCEWSSCHTSRDFLGLDMFSRITFVYNVLCNDVSIM